MDSKNIILSYAKLNTEETQKISATKLRGYLGYLFIDDSEFHHHDENPYRYPLIQYKKIKNELIVLGINDYSKIILDKLSDLKEIVLSNYKVQITSIEFTNITHQVTDEMTKYEFQTPWIALNSKNYEKFKTINSELRRGFLENILIGNFLSALRGMDISVDHKLCASIHRFSSKHATVHKNPFYAFYAQFTTNLSLPDFIGIGNSPSKGFGVIKKI